MTSARTTLDPKELGTSDVTFTPEADTRFLRRILCALVISTIATGAVAAYASVNETQTGHVNFVLPVLASR